MLIANIIAGFALAFEFILSAVLGVNVFQRPQITSSSNNFNSPLTPATTTTTAAPVAVVTCAKLGGPATCPTCPSGTIGGTLQSPNFPNDYGTSAPITALSCAYEFTTNLGHIKMTLVAGANIDYSTDATTPETLQFIDKGITSFSAPTTYPTTADATYTTTSTAAIFAFNYNKNACSSPPCKWEMKFESAP